MKFHYYAETDSLYIDLLNNPGVQSQEAAPGIVLDFDVEGSLVGIDIDNASRVVDLSELEVWDLPIKKFSVTGSSAEKELKLAEGTDIYRPKHGG
ncbi:MAG TPA: DUF2283 domain-containing protein [Spirochaetia bacterium]|nr:DUF2283 domain-containing protein [Spirochaetia bacterium]